MEQMNISIDLPSIDKLHKIAKKIDRSVSGTIRQLIREYDLNE